MFCTIHLQKIRLNAQKNFIFFPFTSFFSNRIQQKSTAEYTNYIQSVYSLCYLSEFVFTAQTQEVFYA